MILGTYGTAEGKKNQNSDFWENQIVLLLSFRKGLSFKKLYHKALLTFWLTRKLDQVRQQSEMNSLLELSCHNWIEINRSAWHFCVDVA